MTVDPERRRFTVDEYYQMARAGILDEDDRLELVDGEILTMTPIGPRHHACVTWLNRLLGQGVGDAALVQIQGPVRLSEQTEPQPDVALLRPRPDRYRTGQPTPEDVLLVVEVAETSSRFDRRFKVPRYGRSGITGSWLIDLDKETVTVYRDPTSTGYRTIQTIRRGETLRPVAFPNLAIAVDDILG